MPRIGWVMVSVLVWSNGLAGGIVSAAQWERVALGSGGDEVVAVAAHPSHTAQLVAASDSGIYTSRDGGRQWERRFVLPAAVRVRYLAVSAAEPPVILAATSDGLYGSPDGGATWSRLFHGAGDRTSDCTVVAFHPAESGTALLGARRGLFISRDDGRQWTAVNIPESARDVHHMAFDAADADRLYLVTADGLFVGGLTRGEWQRRTDSINAEAPEVEEPERLEAEETDEEAGSLHHLSAVAVDPQRPGTVYLAGSRGMDVSDDGGLTWTPLPSAGLPSPEISRLILQRHSPLAVYAATRQGAAQYDPAAGQWTVLAPGMAGAHIHDLAATPAALWAATDAGLYRYGIEPDPFSQSELPSPRELLANFTHEPAIGAVREAAIRYAEVQPEKIARWRRQAALRALLPKVDAGFDHDRSHDVHYDEGTFPNFQIVETEDRNAGFDVSVTWELGDLIWSTDQTTIDVRSKLMVQLRDDLVDELTRTYFERRRLQVVLLMDPPTEPQKLLEKELRVQELTALLDGLTGGYFSKQIQVEGDR